MEHRIEIEEHADQKMIHTIILGIMSKEERDHTAMESVRKMRKNNLSKIIWDVREAELSYSLIHSHMVVLNLEALGLTKKDTVAVIYFHNKEHHEHAQTVAYNRNIFNIGFFKSFAEGVAWLAGTRQFWKLR